MSIWNIFYIIGDYKLKIILVKIVKDSQFLYSARVNSINSKKNEEVF